MEFECKRARDFYQRAINARPAEDRKRLVAAEIMRAVYFATLRRIERRGYDVFNGRIRLRAFFTVARRLSGRLALRWIVWTSTTSSSSAPGSPG